MKNDKRFLESVTTYQRKTLSSEEARELEKILLENSDKETVNEKDTNVTPSVIAGIVGMMVISFIFIKVIFGF